MVDFDVVRCDPADPREEGKTGEEEAGDEVPSNAAQDDEKEESLAREMALLSNAPCPMKGVHQTAADEGAGVNHAGGVDEEPVEETGKADANELGGQIVHDPVRVGQLLPIVDLLDDVRAEDKRRRPRHDAHRGDDSVLLDVEWARVKGPLVAEGPVARRRQSPC